MSTSWIAALLICAAAVCAKLVRLQYGIDFSDESYYIGLAYRFALGDVPLVDEYYYAQLAALLAAPFLWVLSFAHAWPDGIVIASRTLFVAFSCFVAYLTYRSLSAVGARQIALLAATLPVVFTPFNINAISYNTLASGLFGAGAFLAVRAYVGDKPSHATPPFGAGVLHGFACMSYPTFLVPVCVFAFINASLADKPFSRMAPYAAGCSMAGIVCFALLANAGWNNVIDAVTFSRSVGVQGGNLLKVIAGIDLIAENIPNKPLLIGFACLFLVVTFLGMRQVQGLKPLQATAVLALIACLIWKASLWQYTPYPVEAMYTVIALALLAPVFFLATPKDKTAKLLMTCVWVPSLAAGITATWSSENIGRIASIGLYPGAIVALFLAGRLAVTTEGSVKSDRVPASALFPGILVIGALSFHQYLGLYREWPIAELTHRFSHGPFHGIWTTAARHEFITGLAADLARELRSDDRLLVYDDFPAGFILTATRIWTPTVWVLPTSAYRGVRRDMILEWYEKKQSKPTLVVRMNRIVRPHDPGLSYPEQDLLDLMLLQSYAIVLSRKDYSIWRYR